MQRRILNLISVSVLVTSLLSADLGAASDIGLQDETPLRAKLLDLEKAVQSMQSESNGPSWKDLYGAAGGLIAALAVSWVDRRRLARQRRFVRVEFPPFRNTMGEQLKKLEFDCNAWTDNMQRILESYIFRAVESWSAEEHNKDDTAWIDHYHSAALPKVVSTVPSFSLPEIKVINDAAEQLNTYVDQANQHLTNFGNLLKGLSLFEEQGLLLQEKYAVDSYHALRVHKGYKNDISTEKKAFLGAVEKIRSKITIIREGLMVIKKLQ